MNYTVFTLLPDIFDSFLSNSLIARGVSNHIIKVNRINWRENYGIGCYKQIDDKPFGGGHGMVLQPDHIFNALTDTNLISTLYKKSNQIIIHDRISPNNSNFYQNWKLNKKNIRKVTVSLTPRGFPINQQIIEWLSYNFDEIGILCGRYEGFDSRVGELVDLEVSLGNFVLNGGEVGAMALIEGISRLLPGFVTKSENVMHDSFSSGLNQYQEQQEYVIGKRKLLQKLDKIEVHQSIDLFSDNDWKSSVLPKIEHPQYSRPEIWNNIQVPEVLVGGNHKKIQDWRLNWWK